MLHVDTLQMVRTHRKMFVADIGQYKVHMGSKENNYCQKTKTKINKNKKTRAKNQT